MTARAAYKIRRNILIVAARAGGLSDNCAVRSSIIRKQVGLSDRRYSQSPKGRSPATLQTSQAGHNVVELCLERAHSVWADRAREPMDFGISVIDEGGWEASVIVWTDCRHLGVV